MPYSEYVVIKSNKSFSEEDIVRFIKHVNDYVPAEDYHKPIRYLSNLLEHLRPNDDEYLRKILVQEPVEWPYFSDYIDPRELNRQLAWVFRCYSEIWWVDTEYSYPERDDSRLKISEDPREIAKWWSKYERFGKKLQPVRYHWMNMRPSEEEPYRPFEG